MTIKTRFSPSPTGHLHLGNVRAALFSALFATHSQGVFILRIEDTDVTRSDEKFVDILQHDLNWLGITWQEGPKVGGSSMPYWQSQRSDIYAFYYQLLKEKGEVYPCFCSDQTLAFNRKMQLSRGQAPRYLGTCRELSAEDIQARLQKGELPALRFRVPQENKIEFTDLVKGPQHFNAADIGDFIIRRADGSSSFLFCNAIDDSLMGVTHVLRGEDHLANTPRQLMILNALQLRAPAYGHLSLITGDDGSKLSKRHGSSSLRDLIEAGYLSKAVLNYLARLSHTYEQHELMDFSELAHHFHLSKLSRAPARFDSHQLLHWQKEAVLALDESSMWAWLGTLKENIPIEKQTLFIEMMRQNIMFPQEAQQWAKRFFSFPLEFSTENIKILQEAGKTFFVKAQEAVKTHGLDLPSIVQDLKEKSGLTGKFLFKPLRVALTGEEHGPELIHVMHLLGKENILARFADVEKKI